MNNPEESDRIELFRLLQQAKPLVEPLYPDQRKQWVEGSPVAQEICALLAKHPEYHAEIRAEIGGMFDQPCG